MAKIGQTWAQNKFLGLDLEIANFAYDIYRHDVSNHDLTGQYNGFGHFFENRPSCFESSSKSTTPHIDGALMLPLFVLHSSLIASGSNVTVFKVELFLEPPILLVL